MENGDAGVSCQTSYISFLTVPPATALHCTCLRMSVVVKIRYG
jgi:hypothetical protein